MARIEGRGLKRPRMGEMFMGENLVLRIDDAKCAEFWLTLCLTPEEFGDLFARYALWLAQSEQYAALVRLMMPGAPRPDRAE